MKEKQVKKQQIFQLALVVKDYDEALDFYVGRLGFELLEDTSLSTEKRWVRVAPPGDSSCCLLLAKAASEEQLKAVGRQSGGRVFLFMHTDNLERDYREWCAKGVEIVREPVQEPFGQVFVFSDLYGNLWDVIQPF